MLLLPFPTCLAAWVAPMRFPAGAHQLPVVMAEDVDGGSKIFYDIDDPYDPLGKAESSAVSSPEYWRLSGAQTFAEYHTKRGRNTIPSVPATATHKPRPWTNDGVPRQAVPVRQVAPYTRPVPAVPPPTGVSLTQASASPPTGMVMPTAPPPVMGLVPPPTAVPPPPAVSPSWSSLNLAGKVTLIKDVLGLDPNLNLASTIRIAKEEVGCEAEGNLNAQADALLQQIM